MTTTILLTALIFVLSTIIVLLLIDILAQAKMRIAQKVLKKIDNWFTKLSESVF